MLLQLTDEGYELEEQLATTMLSGSCVLRGGVTARYLSEETNQIAVYRRRGNVGFDFNVGSKGGGTLNIVLEVGRDDFATIMALMAQVDRQSAMEAMTEELRRLVSILPQLEDEIVKRARREIVQLAEEKVENAPYGDEGLPRLVSENVMKLVQELSDKEQKPQEADE